MRRFLLISSSIVSLAAPAVAVADGKDAGAPPSDAAAASAAAPATEVAATAEQPAAEAAPPVSLQFTYTGDLWNVASGGIDEDTVYLDALDLQLSIDLEATTGWAGAQAFIYGLYTNGNSVSDLAGDINGVSNIETGLEGVRIVEAWVDQAFGGGKGSLRIGLYDVASEFDAGEVRALFLNAAHGSGTDFAQSGQNGPSMWPVTSLAARVNWNFDNGVYLRGTVADGVPGSLDHPERTTIDFGDGDGLLLAAEAGIAREGRLWSLGAWTYTEDFPDLVSATDVHTNAGAYLAVEESILSRDAGSAFDLSGSLRFGLANADVNPLSSFYGATLVATGLFPSMPDDQLGLAILVGHGGSKFRSLIDAGGGIGRADEINLELTYLTAITESVSIQPDLQWIRNPGLDGSLEDTFVFGVRFQLARNWAID